MSESEAKFWEKVNVGGENDCWLWTGAQWGGRAGDRYGLFTDGRWKYYSHRYAYAVRKGAIPASGLVRHSCDKRLCCNPKHLSLGTQTDNMQDMIARGRGNWAKGENSGKSKITAEQALAIFNDPRIAKEIAKAHGVGITCVGNIKRGETWSHITGKRRAA